MSGPATVERETKDWTWVLSRPCPDCGFAAEQVTVDRLAEVIRDNATAWAAVLTAADAAVRPRPGVWSPLEYACHVRDAHRLFEMRVGRMLTEDGPRFDDWNPDDAAVAGRYAEQDTAAVSRELLDAADAAARRYESVPPEAWGRRGTRADGLEQTVEQVGRYHLHELVHHVWDVRAAVARATVEAYDADAAAYRDATAIVPETVAAAIDDVAAALGPGARVLEIGSGAGRDARLLEARGLSVRRTDVSPAFVALIRADGFAADVLDPLHDPLDDPDRPGAPYDGVWASASLLHVARGDLARVLHRVARACRPGALLRFSVKDGDGEAWSAHGAVTAPRHFVFWREAPLRAVVESAGWTVDAVHASVSARDGEAWLDVRARKA